MTPAGRSNPSPLGATAPDRVVRTVCSPNCMGTCGVNAFVKDNMIIKIEPASYPDPGFERICVKGIAMAKDRIHHPKRLREPMIRAGARGDGRWNTVSWDDAYEYIAEKLTSVAQVHGWKANAWFGMTGNYGARAFTSKERAANCLGGSIFSNLGLTSDVAGFMGIQTTLGAFVVSNDVSTIANAKYLLFAGRNTADTGHSEMRYIFDALESGAKLVVIDPRFSRTASKADDWLALTPGSDVPMVMAMLNVIVSNGLMKEDYVLRHTNAPFLINRHTGAMLRAKDLFEDGEDEYLVWDTTVDGPVQASDAGLPCLKGAWTLQDVSGKQIACRTAFDALWEVWEKYTPEFAETICNVPAETIRRTAIEYATADPAWLYLAQGIQRYHGGHTTFRAYITLSALCGNIGKEHAGVSVLDGPYVRMHMGMSDAWTKPTGAPTHELSGMKLIETITTGQPYPVRSLWIDNHGFGTQSPLFKRFQADALPLLDLFVVSEQVMTDAAALADVVLPVVSYYEDDWDLVGGGEIWFMQLRQRAIPPVGSSRNDYEIYKGICERLGKGEYWQMSLRESAEFILKSHDDPAIRAVDWDVLCRDGVARVPRRRYSPEEMPAGLRETLSPSYSITHDELVPFGDLRFNTPSRRIELYQEQFSDIGEAVLDYVEPNEGRSSALHKKYPLNLITYKIVHSTHSQHTFLPSIQELLPRPMLEMNPEDAAKRGIANGDEVIVFNGRGRFRVNTHVLESVRTGTAAMPQGWWKHAFAEGHPSDLAQTKGSEYQDRVFGESNYPAFDLAVDICLATDAEKNVTQPMKPGAN
ncbi:MAG: anaerobic dehydrogenase, typically selenocysteine-containing [Sphingomonas bacterium]|jgi:anaerobic selenocysteine-containing dehydrogenase|uniref:molybdopterin-containing oxidoreductase family protein n=1 Tax=Sphingomonas bacterium TaxID=1895847 RepID=UPI0026167B36|nr:molybdopterin-dependent oxidoreductase [Sphingomonas bacterium]MDB5710731.1 anaerobic dehydrogenase, typically selenocysteine-containing [Sphingomonas bacterium]